MNWSYHLILSSVRFPNLLPWPAPQGEAGGAQGQLGINETTQAQGCLAITIIVVITNIISVVRISPFKITI